MGDLIARGLAKKNTAQLADTSKAIKPYSYIDYGIAFRSDDNTLPVYDNHASWAHGNVAYDKTDDKVVVFYDVKPSHTLSNNRVLMRKKDPNGNFSAPYVVADKNAQGISCKSQSSGIAKNGDYISLVFEFSGANVFTNIYRSIDKGVTWNSTRMLIGGNPVDAFNGDVTGFLVLKSGRILVLVKQSQYTSTMIYSDDNGLNWNYIAQDFGGNTEPAWCELSDGTIIAYMRFNVDSNYSVKIPARFTKSTDGGLTWTTPVDSTSILDYTNSNGHLIFHEDNKTVEFIHHSRFQLADGYSSLYVSVATQENAKQDKMGEQIRISKLSPQTQPVNGSTGDSGYIGATKDSNGNIHAFYYNGTSAKAQICYMVGKKTNDNIEPFALDHYTGEKIPPLFTGLEKVNSNLFEVGSINLGVGVKDVLTTALNRLRLKKHMPVIKNVKYEINLNNSNFSVGIRTYDSDLKNIWDSGWQTGIVTYFPDDNVSYVRLLIKKTDNSNIVLSDLPSTFYANIFRFGSSVEVAVNGIFPIDYLNYFSKNAPITSDLFEQGGISIADGSNTVATNRIRSTRRHVVLPSKSYLLDMQDSNFQFSMIQFDKNFALLSDSGFISGVNTLITNSNTSYIRLVVRKADNTDVLPSNLPTNFYSDSLSLDKLLYAITKVTVI